MSVFCRGSTYVTLLSDVGGMMVYQRGVCSNVQKGVEMQGKEKG